MKKLIAYILVLFMFVALPMTACDKKEDGSSSSSESQSQSSSSSEYVEDDSSDSIEDSEIGEEADIENDADSDTEEPSSSEESEPEIEKKPAPEFSAGSPSAKLEVKTAYITVKTNVQSTVNVIFSNDGNKINTQTFYDYFNRNKSLEGAISKTKVHKVNADGKTIEFNIEDTSKSYYAHINAVEDETGTWQSSVAVIPIYEPGQLAPELTISDPVKSADGGIVTFSASCDIQGTVYGIITPAGSAKPEAGDIKNNSYSGKTLLVVSSATSTGEKPFRADLALTTASLEKGGFTLWAVAQNTSSENGGFSSVVQKDFNID